MDFPVENNTDIPEFFKVFFPHNCSESLRIPNAFKNYLTERTPVKVLLRGRMGKSWPAELVATKDGLFIQGGWSRLVLDNSLQAGDFLVFKYNGHHLFDIKMFGTSGCEKELVGCSSKQDEAAMQMDDEEEDHYEQKQRQQDEEENEGRNTGKGPLRVKRTGGRGENYTFSGYHPRNLELGINVQLENPFIVTKINPYRSNELRIPHDVREDFRLKFSDKIELQDPEGRFWKAGVSHWKNGRVVVKGGWTKLCKWNRISDDEFLICEFMPSSTRFCRLIRVHRYAPPSSS